MIRIHHPKAPRPESRQKLKLERPGVFKVSSFIPARPTVCATCPFGKGNDAALEKKLREIDLISTREVEISRGWRWVNTVSSAIDRVIACVSPALHVRLGRWSAKLIARAAGGNFVCHDTLIDFNAGQIRDESTFHRCAGAVDWWDREQQREREAATRK